ASRMGDDIDMRAVDPVQGPPGELIARLAPRDVDGRADQVERRQQLVRVVEVAVGADLQLAAVQQAEALRVGARGQGPRGTLRLEPLVEAGDDLALLLD